MYRYFFRIFPVCLFVGDFVLSVSEWLMFVFSFTGFMICRLAMAGVAEMQLSKLRHYSWLMFSSVFLKMMTTCYYLWSSRSRLPAQQIWRVMNGMISDNYLICGMLWFIDSCCVFQLQWCIWRWLRAANGIEALARDFQHNKYGEWWMVWYLTTTWFVGYYGSLIVAVFFSCSDVSDDDYELQMALKLSLETHSAVNKECKER